MCYFVEPLGTTKEDPQAGRVHWKQRRSKLLQICEASGGHLDLNNVFVSSYGPNLLLVTGLLHMEKRLESCL